MYQGIHPGQLIIDDLVGQRVALEPGQTLMVGRDAAFPVGADDRFMHRQFLQFWADDAVWMIKNHGSRMSASVQPRGASSFAELTVGPGANWALPHGDSSVVFTTPECTYELHTTVARTLRPPTVSRDVEHGGVTFGEFIPNEEQRALLQALAEPLIANPGAGVEKVPTVRELGEILGWSQKKINTKIDYLCKQLEASGVTGLSARGGNTPTRRVTLARYAQERYWSLTHRGRL